MSELSKAQNVVTAFRWHLLTTVSAIAILTSLCEPAAADEGADQPLFWIELGGQLERQTAQGDVFVPPFVANDPTAPAIQGFNLHGQKPPLYGDGIEGKVTVQPDNDWLFSASVRYGRANGTKNQSQKSAGHKLHYVIPNNHTHTTFYGSTYHTRTCCKTFNYTPANRGFINAQTHYKESHAIVDFQVGREVGLGLFGNGSSSVVSAGVRFAQFTSKSDTAIHAKPSVEFSRYDPAFLHCPTCQFYKALPTGTYAGESHNGREFHGIGPAISWSGSNPVLGNSQGGEITFDWGANAAVLFGRQIARGNHQTSGSVGKHYSSHRVGYELSGTIDRNREIVVPNVGGFAGASVRYSNAKISFGYRGDFFFGAMDVGIDARTTKTVGFYGPFATISVGIGG